MKYRVPLIFSAFMVLLSGCASTNQKLCDQLRASGQVYATTASCMRCVDTFGASNTEAIRGCAMGMDAEALIGGGKE